MTRLTLPDLDSDPANRTSVRGKEPLSHQQSALRWGQKAGGPGRLSWGSDWEEVSEAHDERPRVVCMSEVTSTRMK